mmetsp:Transcript_25955/g.82236  ORF Transcript_25955/g.82236 Transcript_25955/m.82236 type:complete len:445 (-) Transcript_25955:42-1376(-)
MHALASLSYSSLLIPNLWALLRRLAARPPVPWGPSAETRLIDACLRPWSPEEGQPYIRHSGSPQNGQPYLRHACSAEATILHLIAEGCVYLLPVLDDREVFSLCHPFSPPDLDALASTLNRLAHTLLWTDPAIQAQLPHLSAPTCRLLSQLYERDSRQPFRPVPPPGTSAWLLPVETGVLEWELFGHAKPQEPAHAGRARAVLERIPWVVPFEARVGLFRSLVAREKDALPDEARPEHLKGHRVKIRREHLLEDGYVQLGALSAEKLKGTIRIEFVSELGLAEAGIDRTGVFKEFLEEAIKAAIDEERGLFRRTAQRRLYPSPSSGMAEAAHLRLFEFTGRLVGKALYEGIVLDVALADFFAAKLLGKHASIDELPSLDPELHASLQVVKAYPGDVENDLCLTFVMEEDSFGARTNVELRDGGGAIPVTADNRIECASRQPLTV